MRKIALTIIFIVIHFVNANSQSSFGVKGGLNLASLKGEGVDNLNIRSSVHITGLVEIELSDRFSVQPEIVFSSQGAEESDIDYKATWYLNYINIPLITKYYINDQLSIEAGPQIGFLMNAKLDWSDDDESGLDELEEFISSIDFGIDFGLGYKLESGLIFGGRYNMGMINVLESDMTEGKLTNGVLQMSIGYLFK